MYKSQLFVSSLCDIHIKPLKASAVSNLGPLISLITLLGIKHHWVDAPHKLHCFAKVSNFLPNIITINKGGFRGWEPRFSVPSPPRSSCFLSDLSSPFSFPFPASFLQLPLLPTVHPSPLPFSITHYVVSPQSLPSYSRSSYFFRPIAFS